MNNFSDIDINFYNNMFFDYQNKKLSILPTFNAILMNDLKYIDDYLKVKYIYKNVTLQTGLMLACYIGNIDMVKKLISKEVGYIDLYDRNALFYAYNSINKNKEIIDLLKKYEFINL